MRWSAAKLDHRNVTAVALILCAGMSGFWFIVHALADDHDPIGQVASRASLVSLMLAVAVAVVGVASLYQKNKAARDRHSGRRRRRLQGSRGH